MTILERWPGATIHHSAQLARVILRTAQRTPHHRDAELPAPTVGVVVRAVHLAPAVSAGAEELDAPAVLLCIPECLLDVRIVVPSSRHATFPADSVGVMAEVVK